MTGRKQSLWVTLAEASALVERHPNNLSSTCARAGIKPRKSDGKWYLPKIRDAVAAAVSRDGRNQPVDPTTPRQVKTVLECRILETKLAQLRGTLIPMDEHLSELRTFAAWFRDVLDLWSSEVKALTSDIKLVVEAERLRDRALGRMEEKCKAAPQS